MYHAILADLTGDVEDYRFDTMRLALWYAGQSLIERPWVSVTVHSGHTGLIVRV